MFENFMAVFNQVVVLYILIAVGFACGKFKIFTKDSIRHLSSFILHFVTPCVIVNSFNRDFDSSMLKGLFISFACAVLFHSVNILFATVFLKDSDKGKEKVLKFGAVFSNCGYMALPLQQALFGSEGVFYSAAYIAIFNIFTWTYGALMMGSGKEGRKSLSAEEQKKLLKTQIKKSILNPGVIGIALGLPLFFSPFKLPSVIQSPVAHLAALNTPIPMVIIGFYLSEIKGFGVLKNVKMWVCLALRLLILPVVNIALVYFMGMRGVLLGMLVVSICTPSAANTVMFSALFDRDTVMASEVVSISTLFSIITMPVIVTLGMLLM